MKKPTQKRGLSLLQKLRQEDRASRLDIVTRLDAMDQKLRHMHDRLNYLSATMDAFDPEAVAAHMKTWLSGSQILDTLRGLAWDIDLLAQHITKKKATGKAKK